MDKREILNLIAAFIILTIVISFKQLINNNFSILPEYAIYSILILGFAIIFKKIAASMVDADVEHEIWHVNTWGFKPHHNFDLISKRGIPFGIIAPLFLSLFSVGIVKFCALLTYETRALTRRASRRFGLASFTEMTDWHNGVIGASGILGLLVLSTLAYLVNYEFLAQVSTFYAISNLIPISKLDGTQIFFGSRSLYAVTVCLTLIFFIYAIIL